MNVPTMRFAPFPHVWSRRGWSTMMAEIASQMPCVSSSPCHSAVAIAAATDPRMV